MLKKMKTFAINGNKFEVVDKYAREYGVSGISGTGILEYELYPVTLDDVTKNIIYNLGDADKNIGYEFYVSQSSNNDYCVFQREIKKGDMIIFTVAHKLTSDIPFILVVDENNMIVEKVSYSDVENNPEYILEATDVVRTGGAYKFKNSGTLYMSFIYTDVQVGEFFYLKKTHPSEPLVLYSHGTYDDDATWGDATMKAIMEGRQIFVRVDNADNGKHTAIYSPIYMYQLPNYMNEYLYLFYLKDEKQNIDLSALGAGTIQMPIYGELKLKLSRTYNQTPLL